MTADFVGHSAGRKMSFWMTVYMGFQTLGTIYGTEYTYYRLH